MTPPRDQDMAPATPAPATPAPESDAGDGVIRQVVAISNQRGLHARAAAKFVKLAATFRCEVEVARGETKVSGLSIMGLMMLAAAPGTTVALSAHGQDAEAAIAALADLVQRKFDED